MIGKNTIGKVVTALVLGGMIIASGSMAYAQGTDSTTNNKPGISAQHRSGFMKGAVKVSTNGFKTSLDSLVTAGTITADQETAIVNYMQQKASDMKTQMEKIKSMTQSERQAYFQQNKTQAKTDFLADLVSNGTITQDQATAIKNAMKPSANKSAKTNGFKTILDGYVTAGTITQDEENKITSYMQQKASDMKTQMEKIKNMTPDERKAYFTQNKTQKTDILSELVSQNIITQDQANAMTKLKPSANHKNAGQSKRNMGGNQLKTKLDGLVTAGTITQDQETAVLTLFTPSASSTSKTDNKKGGFKTKLDGLVTAGTITSDQETTILNLFTHHTKTSTDKTITTQTQQ